MNEQLAREAAERRMKTMLTTRKVEMWKARISERLHPRFDGSQNVNTLPVSDDPRTEIITDICRQASGVSAGLYLEDLIPICNTDFQRSQSGAGHDINIPAAVGVDIKMSTETVKKGDKKKVSKSLEISCEQFKEYFWVEFFGESNSENINGVMWYSGLAAHRKLGLTKEQVEWITKKVYDFRKQSFEKIRESLGGA